MIKKRVKIMGILNITPDSFSDGGLFLDPEAAAARAAQMIAEGADIIDIGGESSGPGSKDVAVEEELRRVMPVITLLSFPRRRESMDASIATDPRVRGDDIVISVDTYKSEVARQAIAAGASMVNDVTALRGDPGMAKVIAEAGVSVVLMYSKDPTARTTRLDRQYADVVKTISDFLEERIAFALSRGIKKNQIIIDPGMGAFVSGDPKYSYEILERLGEFKKLSCQISVGVSRKSFLGGAVGERLSAALAVNKMAIQNGADIIRVHDVSAHHSLVSEERAMRLSVWCP